VGLLRGDLVDRCSSQVAPHAAFDVVYGAFALLERVASVEAPQVALASVHSVCGPSLGHLLSPRLVAIYLMSRWLRLSVIS
jgi:hypothetical protein